MTLWSGRFDTAPDPAAFDFGVSFGFDRLLFEDDVTGSIAWADALEAAGMLSREDAEAIVGALKVILEEGRRNPESVAGPDEDVHSFVSVASSNGSAMPAAAFTPAARATSRCRSICDCTCAGVSRCCKRIS